MRKSRFLLLLLVLAALTAALFTINPGKVCATVREPAKAGAFYPDDPEKLSNAIDSFIKDAMPPFKKKPLATISPHAGYIYSGQIAADAFKQAAGYDYDIIAVLGTNHTTPGFNKVSIYSGKGYKTPIGTARIDEKLSAKLLSIDKDFIFRKEVHNDEHSVEVQIPFIQKLFPDAKIITAVIGRPDPDLCACPLLSRRRSFPG